MRRANAGEHPGEAPTAFGPRNFIAMILFVFRVHPVHGTLFPDEYSEEQDETESLPFPEWTRA